MLLLIAVSSWFRIFSVVFLKYNFCWLRLIRIFFRGFASFTGATEVGSVGGGVCSSLMVLSLMNRSVQEITGIIFLNFRHTFLRNINSLSKLVFHSALWTAKCAVGSPGSKICIVLLGERWTTVFEGSVLHKRPSLSTANCRFKELSTPVSGSPKDSQNSITVGSQLLLLYAKIDNKINQRKLYRNTVTAWEYCKEEASAVFFLGVSADFPSEIALLWHKWDVENHDSSAGF